MMSLSVTPLIEEEGADVDGVEGVGEVAISDHLDRSASIETVPRSV